MASGSTVRVGVIVTVALVALFLVWKFLTGYSTQTPTTVYVVFTDSLGTPAGASVTMAGVPVGFVKDVTLDADQRAVMRLEINPKFKIPQGSRFTLSTGVLISDRSVAIIPNRGGYGYIESNSRVDGRTPRRLEDILPKADRLVTSLTEVSDNLNGLLSDEKLRGHLDRSFANVEKASKQLTEAMALVTETVRSGQGGVMAVSRNADLASRNLLSVTSELERFVKHGDLQRDLGGTMSAIRETAESISETAKGFEEIVNDPATREDLRGILTSTRATADSLSRTAQNLERFATDPGLQSDIRQAASSARGAIDEAREALAKVNKWLGGDEPGELKIPNPVKETRADVLLNTDDGTLRADVKAKLSLGHDFVDLGIYDLGERNKLILQPGRPLSGATDIRYGLYAAKLGVGLDRRLSSRLQGSLDLYDPNNARADLRLGYSLAPEWGLLVGVDGLFSDNEVMLGARVRR